VIDENEIVDEQNQRILSNLSAYTVALVLIKHRHYEMAENKCAYLKVVEKAYIFLLKYVKKNKENQL